MHGNLHFNRWKPHFAKWQQSARRVRCLSLLFFGRGNLCFIWHLLTFDTLWACWSWLLSSSGCFIFYLILNYCSFSFYWSRDTSERSGCRFATAFRLPGAPNFIRVGCLLPYIGLTTYQLGRLLLHCNSYTLWADIQSRFSAGHTSLIRSVVLVSANLH